MSPAEGSGRRPASLELGVAKMGRRFLAGLAVVAVLATAWVIATFLGHRPLDLAWSLAAGARPPIVVGLIHSKTGPLAIAELAVIDAEILALEEIRGRGGLAGRRISWEVADGRSDPSTFAAEARRLIDAKADVLVGGSSADCRKAMTSMVQERGNILIFPATFEGIERPSRVIFAGGSSNQTILPAVRWSVDTLKAGRFYVVGSDDLTSRCAVEVAKDAVKASSAEVVGESFVSLVNGEVGPTIEAIKAANPAVVLNCLMGDANIAFYAEMRRAGLTPDRTPIIGFSISENELTRFAKGDVVGHYVAMNYFQSIDRPTNREFVRRFKRRFGEDRPVSDAMVAAYNGLMIWASAVEEAGASAPSLVFDLITRQSLDAPEGVYNIDPSSLIAWRPSYIGKARNDGQFDVVWSIDKPIHPIPFPNTRTRDQWDRFLEGLKTRGDRRPVPPGAR